MKRNNLNEAVSEGKLKAVDIRTASRKDLRQAAQAVKEEDVPKYSQKDREDEAEKKIEAEKRRADKKKLAQKKVYEDNVFRITPVQPVPKMDRLELAFASEHIQLDDGQMTKLSALMMNEVILDKVMGLRNSQRDDIYAVERIHKMNESTFVIGARLSNILAKANPRKEIAKEINKSLRGLYGHFTSIESDFYSCAIVPILQSMHFHSINDSLLHNLEAIESGLNILNDFDFKIITAFFTYRHSLEGKRLDMDCPNIAMGIRELKKKSGVATEAEVAVVLEKNEQLFVKTSVGDKYTLCAEVRRLFFHLPYVFEQDSAIWARWIKPLIVSSADPHGQNTNQRA